MTLLKLGMFVIGLSAGVFAFGQERHKEPPNRVVGMWRPVTIQGTLHGVVSQPFGPHADGLLVFDRNLHFVECIVNPDTPKFAFPDRQNGQPDEIRAAFLGSLGLFGTYSINNRGDFTGNRVDGATFPNWKGNIRENAQLTETVDRDTMSEIFHDGDLTVKILWKRVQR